MSTPSTTSPAVPGKPAKFAVSITDDGVLLYGTIGGIQSLRPADRVLAENILKLVLASQCGVSKPLGEAEKKPPQIPYQRN